MSGHEGLEAAQAERWRELDRGITERDEVMQLPIPPSQKGTLGYRLCLMRC